MKLKNGLSKGFISGPFPALSVVEMLLNLFDFYHLKGSERELKNSLNDLMDSAGEEKVRLLYKIGRAIVK